MNTKLTPTRIRCMKPGARERIEWDSEVTHLGVRVRPNGSKRFVHRITIRGKTLKKTLGHADAMTVDEARDMARRLDRELLEGGPAPGEAASSPGDCPTFSGFIDDVWRPVAAPNNAPLTVRRDEHSLRKHLLPEFGTMPLDGITRARILDWYDRCSKKTPGGANRVLDLLSSVLNLAVRREVIASNPARNIVRNPGRKMTRFLSDEERVRLLDALERVQPSHADHADAIRLLLFTGCRRGEITNLRWSEVREDRIDLKDSKTGPRPVWLGDEARSVLARRRECADGPIPGGAASNPFVFPANRKRGETLGGLELFWRNFRKEIGLGDFRLHDLRHSFATEAVRRGVPLPVVSKLLGHTNIAMTMRYAHVSDNDAEEVAEKIGNDMSNLLIGKEQS